MCINREIYTQRFAYYALIPSGILSHNEVVFIAFRAAAAAKKGVCDQMLGFFPSSLPIE